MRRAHGVTWRLQIILVPVGFSYCCRFYTRQCTTSQTQWVFHTVTGFIFGQCSTSEGQTFHTAAGSVFGIVQFDSHREFLHTVAGSVSGIIQSDSHRELLHAVAGSVSGIIQYNSHR